MTELDELIAEVDVEGALDDVLDRHRRAESSRRKQRVALVAACVVAFVVVTVLAWPGGEQDPAIDIAGNPLSDAGASQSVTGHEGVVVTVGLDRSTVAVGDRVAVTVTIENRGTATFTGNWSEPIECTVSIGSAVRAMHGGVVVGNRPPGQNESVSLANIAGGDASWTAPRSQVADEASSPIATSDPIAAGNVWNDPATSARPCAEDMMTLPVEQLAPGEVRTITGSWPVWIGAGDLPQPATLGIEVHVSVFSCNGCREVVVPVSAACAACSETELAMVVVPVAFDESSRTEPPSPEARRAAVERADVQAMLDTFPSLVPDATGSEPVLGGWLMQTSGRWTQRLVGLGVGLDIDFDSDGNVIEVRSVGPTLSNPPRVTATTVPAGAQLVRLFTPPIPVDEEAVPDVQVESGPSGTSLTLRWEGALEECEPATSALFTPTEDGNVDVELRTVPASWMKIVCPDVLGTRSIEVPIPAAFIGRPLRSAPTS